MPWGHSFQKHLVHNTLCLAVIQTMEAQSQEGLLLLRARQKHHGVRVSAKMSLMVDLTASAWASPCWVLLQHPVLAHVPNFWAKLWKCVFRGCFIRQGNGNHLSLRVQHFTIKTCTNHIIVFMLVSGHGSLREHFHYSILPFFFFFQLLCCCCQYSKYKKRFSDWGVHSTEPSHPVKITIEGAKDLSRSQWMNVAKMLKYTDL